MSFLIKQWHETPGFFEAYSQLAYTQGYAYTVIGDHTPARLTLAEAALRAVTRLRPDAAETHLARANYLYRCLRDYNGALAELEMARPGLPNDPRIFELTGYILRRRGQREEGMRNLERSVELDPRNLYTPTACHQLPAVAALSRRGCCIGSRLDDYSKRCAIRTARALVDFNWKAETKPLHETIDSILAANQGPISDVADTWFICALAERDPATAERALVALGDAPFWGDSAVRLSRSFGEGLLARMMKDEGKRTPPLPSFVSNRRRSWKRGQTTDRRFASLA